MDRDRIVRFLLIAFAAFAAWKWLLPGIMGKREAGIQPIPEEVYVSAPDFVPDIIDPRPDGSLPTPPPEGDLCRVHGNRYEAELSSRGAALTHFFLTDPQYARSDARDMSTTPDHERWRSLRTRFRGEGATDQVKYDRFKWHLEKVGAGADGYAAACKFTYLDDTVQIVKTIAPGQRPFELNVETTVTNLADADKAHAFTIEQFGYRTNKEVSSKFGRVSPFSTELVCAKDNKVERKTSESDFKEGWFHLPAVDRFAAISNYYFSQALVPQDTGPEPLAYPDCGILSEDWFAEGQDKDADDAGNVYHAQLTYPRKVLHPKEAETYRVIAFFGPKERQVLGAAAGGTKGLGDLINLGFFSAVAKVLVDILVFFHAHLAFGNWGVAIILMTICLKTVLFPLTWKSIKSSAAMKRLKPELDVINAKFADDPQAKNMALLELWRKNGVNPMGGCLPQLVQLPVWFAMYTTLQTAVEMYHEKFLWFSDLSAPDKYYVMPLVLGALIVVQQRMTPQQGLDPIAAKMMTFVMPAMFTVMMLFLPAALGVYMLTNSLLGIAQQLVVQNLPMNKGGGGGEITAKQVDERSNEPLVGKGKARV